MSDDNRKAIRRYCKYLGRDQDGCAEFGRKTGYYMRLVSPLFPGAVEVNESSVFTFTIENKDLYYRILKEFYRQSLGQKGDLYLSENDEIVSIAERVEMITDFVSLETNQRKLLVRVNRVLESEAIQGEAYVRGMDLLAQIECYLDRLAEVFPFSVEYSGIELKSLIKMSSPRIVDDEDSDIGHILNYLELVTELEGDKLFVMTGMKSYFSDDAMQLFVNTAVLRKYKILLLESCESVRLENEDRLLLDNDICEI